MTLTLRTVPGSVCMAFLSTRRRSSYGAQGGLERRLHGSSDLPFARTAFDDQIPLLSGPLLPLSTEHESLGQGPPSPCRGVQCHARDLTSAPNRWHSTAPLGVTVEKRSRSLVNPTAKPPSPQWPLPGEHSGGDGYRLATSTATHRLALSPMASGCSNSGSPRSSRHLKSERSESPCRPPLGPPIAGSGERHVDRQETAVAGDQVVASDRSGLVSGWRRRRRWTRCRWRAGRGILGLGRSALSFADPSATQPLGRLGAGLRRRVLR